MNDALKMLHAEHREIEKVLRALEGICERLDHGQRVAPEVLTQVVDFISTFADGRHHRKEEKCLFPALESAGMPRDGGPVGVMLHDHEIGRGLVRAMAGAIEDYREGFEPATRRFTEAARRFAEHLTQHIAKEDDVLFPMSARFLPEEEMAALWTAFCQAEEEMGLEAARRYRDMAASLEREWAVPLAQAAGAGTSD